MFMELFMRILATGPTINQNVYKFATFDAFKGETKRIVGDKVWLLHHDNAPAHNALSILQFLAEISVLDTRQSGCKLKGVIKGTRFQDSKAITTTVTKELRHPNGIFQKCIEAWQQRYEQRPTFEHKKITLKGTSCNFYVSTLII